MWNSKQHLHFVRMLSLALLVAGVLYGAGCGSQEGADLYKAAPKDSKSAKQPAGDNGTAAAQGGPAGTAPAGGGAAADANAGAAAVDISQFEAANTVLDESPEDGWGHLVGRFEFAGTPPVAEKLKVNKDTQYCSMHHPVDESLLVSDAKSIQNVVVYLRSNEDVKIHPSYEDTADSAVEIDNKWCRFDPHVALVRTNQPVKFHNSDSILHNVKGELLRNESFNFTVPLGEAVEKIFPNEERIPMPLGCNIHPWMAGWVLVRQDPYMAVSDQDGVFVIRNLPAGEHELQLYHETSGYLDKAKVSGKTYDKGRVTVTIKSGEVTNLENIPVPSTQF